MSDFWQFCLLSLQKDMAPQLFNCWIKPLRLEENTKDKTLSLITPNGFFQKWVREHYLKQITNYATDFYGKPVKIELVIAPSEAKKPDPVSLVTPKVIKVEEASPPFRGNPALPSQQRTRLFANLTFESLVVGKANDLARAAAMQVACNPGISYNPLFIYGGNGLGKTHLIHAIGNKILAEHPEKNIRYMQLEDYYRDISSAYLQHNFEGFKREYRALDVLLLDDVQFFHGKTRSQEEFFYLFNAMIEAKKQIILTCDTYPKDINGLDNRLVTRFDWGLTVQIEPPELEMRVAILKKKAMLLDLDINDEAAFFIAKNLRSNVRELEGAVNKVRAYSDFHGCSVSLELAKEALKDTIGSIRNISIEYIQKLVSDFYKIKIADFHSKKRTQIIVKPRQIAMWLCREVTSHSFPEIGEAFGGRDHTTVIHAVKTIDNLRVKNSLINHDLHVLLQDLKS